MKKGFTDKASTEQLASKMEMEARKRVLGLINPEEEKQAEHRTSAIEGHLQAFEKSRHAKDNTAPSR